MADKKISDLTSGSTAQTTDKVPAARAGATVYLTVAMIIAAVVASGSLLPTAGGTMTGPVVLDSGTFAGAATVTLDTATHLDWRQTDDLTDATTALTLSNCGDGDTGKVWLRQDNDGNGVVTLTITGATLNDLNDADTADVDCPATANALCLVTYDCSTVEGTLFGNYSASPGAAAGGGSSTTSQAQIPIATDDTGDGYAVGDRVCSTAAQGCYTAVDVTSSAAVWRRDTDKVPVQMAGPGFGGGIEFYGSDGVATSGTTTTPSTASTNTRTALRRTNVASTGGSFGANYRGGVSNVWRGDAAGLGGFFVRYVWAVSTTATGQMAMVGLFESNPGTPSDPTATASALFVGNDDGDTNLQVMHNDASGNVTSVDLGAGFPAANTSVAYDVTLYAAPNGSEVCYLVVRLDNGAQTGGCPSTNLPPSTSFLSFYGLISDMSDDAVGLDIMHVQSAL